MVTYRKMHAGTYRFDMEKIMEFKEITFEDINTLRDYTKLSGTRNCEFSMVNVFFWNNREKLRYAIIDDVLVYKLIEDDTAYYSVVELPENLKEFWEKLEADAAECAAKIVVNNLSEAMVLRMEREMVGQIRFWYEREYSDYIYEVDNLINLSGSKYHGKKNHLNKFMNTYEFSYEEITDDSIEECREMKNRWAVRKGGDISEYKEELEIIDNVLDNYGKMNLTGGIIRIDGEVVAFTIGEAVSSDTFVTHFEKAYEDIPGLYQAINQQFAANSISGFKYVNREDDIGLKGIRQAKLSYRPVMMFDKYNAEKTI